MDNTNTGARDASTLVTQAPWLLLLTAAGFAYLVQLLERIKSRRVRSFFVEVLEFVVCVGIAFGTYMISHFLRLDERLVWVASVYFGHKGTRYVFAKLDLAAAQHLSRILQEEKPPPTVTEKPSTHGEVTEMP